MLLAAFMFYVLLGEIKDKGKRYSYVIVLWVTYMYIVTEVLSLMHAVNRACLFAGWILLDATLAVIIFFGLKKKKLSLRLNIINVVEAFKRYPIHIIIGAVTFLWAIGTIPHNWDSMTYHLTRVAHWTQDGTVAHFSTNNIRQVASPALASFVNLHVYIMCGKKDIFLNMLQWSCYVTNAWLVVKLAYKIGCSERWAKISSLLFMCMPIAFAEALTTQVDHFATVWLLIFAYFILDFVLVKEHINYDKHNVAACLTMGACVVYGYLTKPTVSVGMFMMALGLLIICIKRKNPVMPIIKLLMIVAPLIAIFIAPEIIRNIISFQALNPPSVGQRQVVGTVQPSYLMTNFLKNFTFNFPNIYIYRSNRIVYELVTTAARVLRVELDHPSISEDGGAFKVHEAQTFGHDTAVNPVIFILAVIVLCWCIYRHIKQKQNLLQKSLQKTAMLTYFTFGIFCLFCAIVRWEPYVSRYMLPYLALLCPIIAVQLQDINDNCKLSFVRSAVLPIVYFICIVDLFAMTWFHGGIMKGSWSDGYYVMGRELASEYQEVINDICESDVESVGMEFMTDDCEYPMWNMAKKGIELAHINVGNETAKYSDEQFVPDCILSTYGLREKMEFGGEVYILIEKSRDNMYIWEYVRDE